jgi:hypothetical protein
MPDAHANITSSILFVDNGNRLLADEVLAFIENVWGEAGECSRWNTLTRRKDCQ